MLFLSHKLDTFSTFIKYIKKITNEKGTNIVIIRSDHGSKFDNSLFENFYNKNGIIHNFSTPRTPQQNGMVERKNRTLKEMACTMLCENNLLRFFWVKKINNISYILNRALVRPILKKTPYELWKDRRPNISYFYVIGCKCFIHNNNKENLGKFDARSDEEIFLGYSITSKAYRVFNKKTLVVEESIHVTIDESNLKCLDRNIKDDENLLED